MQYDENQICFMVCEKLDFEYKSEAGFSALSATVAISDKNLQYITCTRLTAVIDTQVLTTRPIHQMCVMAVSFSITPFQKCIEEFWLWHHPLAI